GWNAWISLLKDTSSGSVSSSNCVIGIARLNGVVGALSVDETNHIDYTEYNIQTTIKGILRIKSNQC
ncbi:hypothetical protein BpHYR1_025728, partial [Brachionus plicatilis]